MCIINISQSLVQPIFHIVKSIEMQDELVSFVNVGKSELESLLVLFLFKCYNSLISDFLCLFLSLYFELVQKILFCYFILLILPSQYQFIVHSQAENIAVWFNQTMIMLNLELFFRCVMQSLFCKSWTRIRRKTQCWKWCKRWFPCCLYLYSFPLSYGQLLHEP